MQSENEMKVPSFGTLIKEAFIYDAYTKRLSEEEDAAFLARIRAAIFGNENDTDEPN